MGHDAVQQTSNKPYLINTHQCKLLENVMHRLGVWINARVLSRGATGESWFDLDAFLMVYLRRISSRGQALLDECSNGDPDLLLGRAVKQEENKGYFSLVLEELSELLSNYISCYSLCQESDRKETADLLHFLQSAREDSLSQAALKDRRNLLAWVTEIIKAQSDHDDNTVERARFLQGVLSAHTIEAVKKARHISAEGLVYGNTLGHGGNAKVVKASWHGVGGFAVKENRVRHYHDKEVQAMLGITHANVMHMIAYSSEPPTEQGINERSVVLMDLMDGDLDGFLSELPKKGLRSKRHLNVDIDIPLQIARGLKYLHENKIVHRDLKPANILYEKLSAHDADVVNFKIADFGSSRSPFDHRTVATAPVGTRMYMAPEMMCADDTSMYGPEVDIYSFAMICYKVMTGMDPSDLTWRDVLQGKRPPLKASASCPQALVSFIHKCWHQDPDKRPSASQVYDFLNLFKCIGLLTMPARETCCLHYGITDTLLEKLVSFLGKEWLETEARALEEGTSVEDMKLRKQVTDFISRLSKEPRRNWLSLPFFRLS